MTQQDITAPVVPPAVPAVPPTDAKKKKRKWPWIVVGVPVALIVMIIAISANSGGNEAVAEDKPVAVAEEVAAPAEAPVEAPAAEAPAEPVEPPAPVYSLSQQNAIDKGRSYLAMTGFSRTGLITQLEFEGYSAEDATMAADTIAPDWNAEAAEKAQSYLDMTSFSREGLYEQLAFEGFEPAQIEAGLASVGY